MKRITIVLILATIATAALHGMSAQTPAPQDPGEVTLNRACTVCHNLGEVKKFKGYYTRDQWADVVRTMRADGAVVKDDEVKALVDYLFRMFGKAEPPEGDGRKILESSCVGCHDLSVATNNKRSRADWQDIVGRMIGMGAPVGNGQIPTLVDYLAKNFGS